MDYGFESCLGGGFICTYVRRYHILQGSRTTYSIPPSTCRSLNQQSTFLRADLGSHHHQIISA